MFKMKKQNISNTQLPANLTRSNYHIPQWVLLVLSMLYVISPIDAIPDVPVVGWVDDVLVVLAGGLNLIESYLRGYNTHLANIVKLFKWIAIILGVIMILLIVLLGTLIVKLFSS
ncbi:DUF1232 domain-containing protein [Riemerella anatipestifer]|nr:DUF1232 domain-containing protein [Riemerella anatipestifer]MRN03404.1 DUF1232 domain-containing protein [Riemerella anatipestifer]MRN17192.1 DUF1232 domain-containing protein [Riemerella anatipestifer]